MGKASLYPGSYGQRTMNPDLIAWSWTDYWPYAILFIALVSWGLYQFLAPAGWREWAGAGVVQAFIIALFAEMYGFPLTVYVLAGQLDLPLTHLTGHVWPAVLGLGPRTSAAITLGAYSVMLLGALLIVKGWVHIYASEDALVQEGVYELMRHPQYVGIMLIVAGQLIDWPTFATIILSPLVLWLYVRLAYREEKVELAKFGVAYERYRQRVPMFVPHWKALRSYIARQNR